MQQPSTPKTAAPTSAIDSAFERKVRASQWSLRFETFWLRLWALFAIIGLFLVVSFVGVWSHLGATAHMALLVLFGLGALGSLAFAVIGRSPTRDRAIARIEKVSGMPHRPASSYEDTLSASAGDATTQAIWQAHRERLAAKLAKLRVSPPEPKTHRFDPMALRALGGLGLLMGGFLLGDRAPDRLSAAFRLGPAGLSSDARLDAWITPPPYTGKPPIMLADGQRPGVSLARDGGAPFEVPERSVLVIRASGTGGGELAVDYLPDGAKATEKIRGEAIKGVDGIAELKTELRRSGTMTVPGQGKPWTFVVTPDLPPKIALTKDPEPNQRGAMKLSYKVEDDYGVVGAEAKFAKLPEAKGDEKTAWARTDVLTGPRPPLERAPKYVLRLPQTSAQAGSKPGEAMTYLELGAHPWAGLKVRMTLEAKDAAGQIGKSEPFDMTLPSRRFTKPLARALIEQRRKLVADPRYRGQVVQAMSALMIEPEGFIEQPQVYLGMTTATKRLQLDRTRAGLKSVINQLWHVALRIEDGNLSDAEKRLKDAQDKLSKALDEGASEEEIEKLMKELRQAMNDYVEQLAKQNEGQDPDENADGQDKDEQQIGQNDLEKMMRDMEKAAKNGSREQAQQMLSEMRDLMDRLQAQKNGDKQKGDKEAGRQMQKKMDELGETIGEQQKLMDETFNAMKMEGQKNQPGSQQGQKKDGGRAKPGQPGEQGDAKNGNKGKGQKGGQKGQKGQGENDGEQGAGEQGESAEAGEGGMKQGNGLGDRQKKLAEKLDKLKREMKQMGAGGKKELDEANDAMNDAEKSIKDGALDDATQQQADALDKMRQGAQKMQQEMAKNGKSRYGENGETPRDPLGRPQKSQGPDDGTSVKVPGEIDVQRAREILEELRKRSAEQTRPPVELDYLERLLKRF
jgi:uncharacterized protein (TIGR02302 family)